MSRRAREIMQPGAECIREEDSVTTAAQRTHDVGVGSFPICDADDPGTRHPHRPGHRALVIAEDLSLDGEG